MPVLHLMGTLDGRERKAGASSADSFAAPASHVDEALSHLGAVREQYIGTTDAAKALWISSGGRGYRDAGNARRSVCFLP